MALKPFTFKEVSLLIRVLFFGVTSVHKRIGFKDIKPSPSTYETGWMISDSL